MVRNNNFTNFILENFKFHEYCILVKEHQIKLTYIVITVNCNIQILDIIKTNINNDTTPKNIGSFKPNYLFLK